MNKLRTAVIGVGSLGRHHARNHAQLSSEGKNELVAICDIREETARKVAEEWKTNWTTDWRSLVGQVDAVSLATPTESHCEIACALLETGVHVLVEKPIARTIEEADRMIATAKKSSTTLMVGHLERYNPALVALRPHVSAPLYFEIHRVGQFTARSLDIDVVLDVMIHDLDIVHWLVGEDVEVIGVHAVGIPVLTKKVDAANARIEFANGAVANITASRIGTEKIRKMRFFQPHDYVIVDYLTNYASISSLAPPQGESMWPGVNVRKFDVNPIEPLRAEIEDFLDAVNARTAAPIPGEDGRRALALALRALERIHEHAARAGVSSTMK
jgi:predicted dehydrogenase